MSTFIEQLDQYGWNRRLANKATVQPAAMADGEDGVVLFHGKSVIVLARHEAKRLLTEMGELLEDA